MRPQGWRPLMDVRMEDGGGVMTWVRLDFGSDVSRFGVRACLSGIETAL